MTFLRPDTPSRLAARLCRTGLLLLSLGAMGAMEDARALSLALSNEPELEVAAPPAAAQATPAPRRHRKSRESREGATIVGDEPSPVLSGPRFVYHAENKRLNEVLQDFAASQGRPAVVTDGVEGVVTGNFDNSPAKFLNAISTAYSLIWYDDGTALYFYPAKAIQSRIFKLVGYTRTDVNQLLKSLSLGDRRYPVRYSAADNVLLVYGPPRHVELVALAVEALDAAALDANAATTQIFPLRFASAADQMYGETKIAGMVSTLRALYGGNGNSGGTPGMGDAKGDAASGSIPNPTALASKLNTMYGNMSASKLIPETPKGKPDAPSTAPAAPQVGRSEMRSPVNLHADEVTFQADEGTNSVIVHAGKSRMAEFGTLIRQLDQRPQLVELEAMIVDVSSDSVNQLGVDWSFQTPGVNVNLGSSPTSLPGFNGSAVAPFVIGTLLANAGRTFSAQLQALESKGRARIVSKPKVLGVANRAAMMKEKRVVSVRVSGNLDANLFQIEAGTLLRMTPQPVVVNGRRQIKLTIYIEDGNFETGTVDQVPVVKKTEIQTEAYVGEGESLLIAGITVDSDTTQNNGVPGLSQVPLLGRLFSATGNRLQRSERMFLITPKLIGPAPSASASPCGPPVSGAATPTDQHGCVR